jgi:hypothetical protein
MRGTIMKKLFAAGAGVMAIGLGVAAAAPPGAAIDSHTYSSCNWYAGYGMQAQDINAPIHSVSASWIEPRVRVHGYHDSHATFLVGYDGDITGDVFNTNMPQIGTEADSVGGLPRYYAWYSPGRSNGDGGYYRQTLRYSVRPGDRMAAVVTSVNLRSTVKLTDVRPRKHRRPLTSTFTKRFKESEGNIFSWNDIVVGVTKPDLRLVSDFGTVYFTGVKVNGAVIGSFDPDIWQLYWVDSYGNTLAKTSQLGRRGDSFSIAWKRGK